MYKITGTVCPMLGGLEKFFLLPICGKHNPIFRGGSNPVKLQNFSTNKNRKVVAKQMLVGNAVCFIFLNQLTGVMAVRAPGAWSVKARCCGKGLRKVLWESAIGKCCGKGLRKVLWEIFFGKCCGKGLRKVLWEDTVERCCWKRSPSW